MTGSYETQGGRTVVTLHDDGGVPYKWVSEPINMIGQQEYDEKFSIPLTPDKTTMPPRPALTRGQIVVSGSSAFNAAFFQYVLVDVVVLGYVGSTPTVIARAQLGGEAQQLRVTFQDDDTFDRVGVLARQLTDGEPSSTTANIQSLQLSAILNMWS